ncbi:hypothetical protein [Kitasatospora griseola]|uniref:hypothetical protein n=1 Tax=Kitasatospora griseola TaxID=2064 RepID=UPI003830020D
MIGDIHIHPMAPAIGPAAFNSGPALAIPVLRHAAFRSALVALGHACERAATALSSAGLPGVGEEKR